MKIFRIFIVILVFISSFSLNIKAEENDVLNKIYENQFKISGAEKIKEFIPKESKKHLESIGIHHGKWQEIINLAPEKIFAEIVKIIKEKAALPFKSFLPVLSIMLLSSLIKSIYPNANNKNMEQILNTISSLSVCICIIKPIINCIFSASLVIKTAANFILCCVPITAGIMVISGKPFSAASYNGFIILAGEVICYLSENFIIPFMSVLLGISLISSFSCNLKLDFLCNAVHKIFKNILEFSSAAFLSMFTLEHIVASSGDCLSKNALKLALNSCVPIIGGIISDSLSTVEGCIKLLKSGVGAFGIIAGIVIFLPAFIECFLWISFTNISKGLSDIMEFKRISCLLKSISNIISTMFAILSFSMIILIVSSALMLILGGN